MDTREDLRSYRSVNGNKGLVQVLHVTEYATADYYVERFAADEEMYLCGRRVGNVVEWARVRGTIVREDADQVVIVMDRKTFTHDEGTRRIAEFRLV